MLSHLHELSNVIDTIIRKISLTKRISCDEGEISSKNLSYMSIENKRCSCPFDHVCSKEHHSNHYGIRLRLAATKVHLELSPHKIFLFELLFLATVLWRWKKIKPWWWHRSIINGTRHVKHGTGRTKMKDKSPIQCVVSINTLLSLLGKTSKLDEMHAQEKVMSRNTFFRGVFEILWVSRTNDKSIKLMYWCFTCFL